MTLLAQFYASAPTKYVQVNTLTERLRVLSATMSSMNLTEPGTRHAR